MEVVELGVEATDDADEAVSQDLQYSDPLVVGVGNSVAIAETPMTPPHHHGWWSVCKDWEAPSI